MLTDNLQTKSILILGFGREGLSTLNFLRKSYPEKEIGIADQKELEKLDVKYKHALASDKKVKLHLGGNYQQAISNYDIVFKSPGINVDVPKEKLQSQANVFLDRYAKQTIGVTGTKGKSTTASLIHHILKEAGHDARLVGNIGSPVFDNLEEVNDKTIFVYEFSSFQLETVSTSPHIAVFLNIFKEHLDFHKTYENYKNAKANITKHQHEEDFLIYNEDINDVVKIVQNSKAQKFTFSLKKETSATVKEGYITNDGIKVMPVSEVTLKGEFNLNNILAALLVANIMQIPLDLARNAIKTFKPLKHRLQEIKTVGQITFYNDSIATVPQSTIAALDTLKGQVGTLIVGGFDRGLDYTQLAQKISDLKIPNIILFPTTGEKIFSDIENQGQYKPQYYRVNNMEEAISTATKVTAKGKVCLLSPASPSFNLFKNFEDRGDQFISEVDKLKEA